MDKLLCLAIGVTAFAVQGFSCYCDATTFANIHSYLPNLFCLEDAKDSAIAMVEKREAKFRGR